MTFFLFFFPILWTLVSSVGPAECPSSGSGSQPYYPVNKWTALSSSRRLPTNPHGIHSSCVGVDYSSTNRTVWLLGGVHCLSSDNNCGDSPSSNLVYKASLDDLSYSYSGDSDIWNQTTDLSQAVQCNSSPWVLPDDIGSPTKSIMYFQNRDDNHIYQFDMKTEVLMIPSSPSLSPIRPYFHGQSRVPSIP